MKHIAAFFMAGLVALLISAVTGDYTVGALSVQVGDLMVNVAATFLGLAALVGVYKLVGEDQTITLLRQLLRINQSAAELSRIGVDRIVTSRTDVEVYEIHERMRRAQDVLIVARNFNAIKYSRVQALFDELTGQGGTSVRLLLCHDADGAPGVERYIEGLPARARNQIAVRYVDSVSVGLYAWDDGGVLTLYTNALPGAESPVLMCSQTSGAHTSLFSIYKQEFNSIWATADQRRKLRN